MGFRKRRSRRRRENREHEKLPRRIPWQTPASPSDEILRLRDIKGTCPSGGGGERERWTKRTPPNINRRPSLRRCRRRALLSFLLGMFSSIFPAGLVLPALGGHLSHQLFRPRHAIASLEMTSRPDGMLTKPSRGGAELIEVVDLQCRSGKKRITR